MEAAGAELMGRTANDGTMGIPALERILAIRKIAGEIDRWAAANQVVVHIPVDSPAANFPMCKRTKRRGARVVHLVAPQMWAWGGWRIRKLRRLTDHVLCLLPFEEAWFRARGVDATFVGHPVLNGSHDSEGQVASWVEPPNGTPRLLLLPGSRTIEVDRNAELLMEVLAAVRQRFPQTSALVAAASPVVAGRFTEIIGALPERTLLLKGVIDQAAAWCDFAVAVSGTVSLDLTRAHKPLIGLYRTGTLARIGANMMLKSPHRLLPNIIAGKSLVPEFVPWSGSTAPIIDAALRMARDANWRAEISRGLAEITSKFVGHDPGVESARIILRIAGLSPKVA